MTVKKFTTFFLKKKLFCGCLSKQKRVFSLLGHIEVDTGNMKGTSVSMQNKWFTRFISLNML